MDYIKIRFIREFDHASSTLERSIEGVMQSVSPLFSISQRIWKPQMDIYETPEEVIILGEIAGVDKDDLELEISSKAVKIFGRRKEMTRVENASYRLAEIQFGKFERLLFLPALIDTEIVSASYQNGMLQIRLAKISQSKVHTIPIGDE
jgi:HSP20 family protein